MKDFEKININDGVDIISVSADRFKTNEIALSFIVPLKEETAASNALLAYLISQTTKSCPELSDFNKKLAMLYGASINAFVSKLGENQCITIEASGLDDRFAIGDEVISEQLFDFLCKLVFDAKLDDNGDFFEEDILREKRLLIERIESEENDKRVFALRRLESLMFEKEPYSINKYGDKESIEKVSSSSLKSSLDYLINSSKIQITVVGDAEINGICETAKKYFGGLNRKYVAPVSSVFIDKANDVKTVTERMEVKQGKLVLGFRVNNQSEFEGNPEMRLFSDIFGGGPYSKLFNNVREKLSLCYYCSARYDRRKSSVIIQCGCEEENMDKAVEEILHQLEDIRKGNIDEELSAGKMALSDAINNVSDDSISLLSWYANQICDKTIISPTQSVKANQKVTKEDIVECAGLLSLDTIYKLVSKKEGE
ncbi:MAG: insulinase family protein [Eubacterium sp.]|nr:insulinase family protein [Eubacterium sp.]